MYLDKVSFNKALIYPEYHGYQNRSQFLSKYRSITIHTTNGNRGSSFYNEAKYILTSPDISAHYLIGKDGQIVQFLDPHKHIAWHAGSVRATRYSNVYSIGIEMHNTPTEGHCTGLQLHALDELTRYLLANHGIDPLYVETHRYTAIPAGRKIDPSGFPNDEFYAWRNTLGYVTYRVNNVRGVNIRQAPNVNAPIAGTLEYNATFISDGINVDENGQYINGVNTWAHMSSGLGFVHMSNLVVT